MDGVEWGEGEEELTHCLREEHPRVSTLPVSIRYRTFAPPAQDTRVRVGRSVHDFYLYRRRRLDSAIDAELIAYGSSVVQPLQCVLTDSFAIAQRQQATYQWLAQRHTADEILHRFAVDRKLNAPPCLAAVNRSLSVLGREGGADAVLDVLEDVLLDTAIIPLSTLLEAIRALPNHPVRAARVALTFHGSLGSQTVPASVWGNLGAALAQASLQMPKPLEDHFIELFERVLAMASASTGRLSESLVVAFGRCLLSSSKPCSAATHLVREELLSGRSRDGFTSAPLHLGGFLSDLLVELCRNDEKLGTSRHSGQETDTLTFACDVMKYTFAVRVQLAPKVFDEVLALCDRRKEYYRMCILFLSMCVLSTPSLVSLLRVLEVVAQIRDVRAPLERLLPVSCIDFFLWCLQRYPGLYESPVESETQRNATRQVGALLGCLAVEESNAEKLPALLQFLIEDEGMSSLMAASAVSAVVRRFRELRCSADKAVFTTLHAQHEAVLAAVLQLPTGPLSSARPTLATAVTVELHRLLPSESVYCTVLSATALATLASRPAAEKAFVHMMEAYQRKGGAVALLPFESVCAFLELHDGALRMLRTWHRAYSWMAVLSLGLSLQLEGTSCCEVCCAAFAAARQVHKKVMFICGSEAEAAAAKEKKVEPVIVMEALMRRLSGQ
ncbi:hypothetical protein JIQ42_04386 [Leishmania sp. Namibia]|uniref:hypothetical protein n=1 Tax=Leishmania sp. Namibia TaxID=2802991 RepID=UPI001B60430F|nr:hypothetical protein JIQ42_04386 [Leishmania sp. Namibia]